MSRTIQALLVTSLVFSSGAFASDICEVATEQFKDATAVYIKGGGVEFMKRVLKNGPLEGDKRALAQAQNLSQIEQFFGPIQSSSVLSTKPLGKRACFLVGVLEYENGPAFAIATYYQTKKGVGATSMSFKTEPEAVFPSSLLVQ